MSEAGRAILPSARVGLLAPRGALVGWLGRRGALVGGGAMLAAILLASIFAGASLVRVHDVAPTAQAARMAHALMASAHGQPAASAGRSA